MGAEAIRSGVRARQKTRRRNLLAWAAMHSIGAALQGDKILVSWPES